MNYVRSIVIAFCFLFDSPVLAQDPPGAAVNLSGVALSETALRVHFIDIGGGLAALIETPSGQHILIDGGKHGLTEYTKYVKHFVGREPIDILIVTHADDDHFFNMTKIIRGYTVGEYLNTGYTSRRLMGLARWPKFVNETVPALVEDGTIDWTPIGDYADAGEFEIIEGEETDSPIDDVIIQYLNVDQQPPESDPFSGRIFKESEQRNNASLVFKVIYGKTSFLFTGDINGRPKKHPYQEIMDSEEKELVDRHVLDETYGLNATVLQVAHHGSDGSSSLPFVRAVSPEWAVITAGDAHGHPTKSAVDRLKSVIEPNTRILRTDDSGTEQWDANGDDITSDPTGDDNFVFEVDANGITTITRIKVD